MQWYCGNDGMLPSQGKRVAAEEEDAESRLSNPATWRQKGGHSKKEAACVTKGNEAWQVHTIFLHCSGGQHVHTFTAMSDIPHHMQECLAEQDPSKRLELVNKRIQQLQDDRYKSRKPTAQAFAPAKCATDLPDTKGTAGTSCCHAGRDHTAAASAVAFRC